MYVFLPDQRNSLVLSIAYICPFLQKRGFVSIILFWEQEIVLDCFLFGDAGVSDIMREF